MSEKLNDRLKKLLAERGISQRKLAKMSGITESSVSHYLKGDRIPNADTLIKLADALATTPDYILKGEMLDGTTINVIDSAVENIRKYAHYLSYAQRLEVMEALVAKDEDEA